MKPNNRLPADTVAISSSQRRVRVPRKRIIELVAHVAAVEGRTIEQVDIAVVGRRRMATLNELHLRHRGPTDVLSFDLGDGLSGGLCAQIVVCSDVATVQARRRGHAPWKELLLYITHGLLHVIGYDDQSGPEARIMHAREDELLEAFGIGRVYGGGDG